MVRLFPTPRPGYTALYLVSSFFCCFAVLLFCCSLLSISLALASSSLVRPACSHASSFPSYLAPYYAANTPGTRSAAHTPSVIR
jgi:hypothetical protein